MTSDYISEAIGLQGWERALNQDAYMAGEEVDPYVDLSSEMVALAKQMANVALVAMRDPRRAIASLLVSPDGADAVGKDALKHEATTGAHVTNCRVGSNFGTDSPCGLLAFSCVATGENDTRVCTC